LSHAAVPGDDSLCDVPVLISNTRTVDANRRPHRSRYVSTNGSAAPAPISKTTSSMPSAAPAVANSQSRLRCRIVRKAGELILHVVRLLLDRQPPRAGGARLINPIETRAAVRKQRGCAASINFVSFVKIQNMMAAWLSQSRAIDANTAGTRIAMRARMSSLAAIFVVISSVGLSVGISRLAVEEMFRLVRSDAKKRNPQPPAA